MLSIQVLQNKPRDHSPGCDFVPPLVDHTRYFCNAPARLAALQTCLFWHAVTQLFAGWCHLDPFNALNILGVGLG